MKRALLIAFFLSVASSIYTGPVLNLIGREHFAFIHTKSGLEINYDSDIKMISATLGKPTVNFDQTKANRPRYKNYVLNGIILSVLPDNDIIIYIKVTNREFTTRDGVGIGDNFNSLTEVYGPPAFQKKNYMEFHYSDISETWGLGFTSNDCGLISEIEIGRGD